MDLLLDSLVSVARPHAIYSAAIPSPPTTADAQPNPSPPSLLPAPPLHPPAPPASPSTSNSNLASRTWPENHNGPLLLFFDPFSSEISSLKTKIQNKLPSSGRTLPTTLLAFEATHVILDPDCPQSSWVRQAARPDQHVVRFEWIEDSLLHGFSVPEGGYQMDSRGSGGAATSSSSSGNGKSRVMEEEERAEEEEGPEMEEREERSDSGPDDPSSEDEKDDVYAGKQQSRVQRRPPGKHRPVTKGSCHNCLTRTSNDWRRLKEKGDAQTCGGCRLAYYNANKKNPGSGDAAPAARKKLVEEDERVGPSSGTEGEVVDSEDGERVPASRNPFASVTRHRKRRLAWSESEQKELAQLIADSPGSTKLGVHKSFSSQHPERTASATKNQYDLNRSWYETEVRRLRRKGRKEHRIGAGSIAESDSDSNLDARPSPLPSASIPNREQPVAWSSRLPGTQGPSRNTTIEQPPRLVPAVASSSTSNPHQQPFFSLSNPNHLPHPHHHSLPRSSAPSYDTETEHQPQPYLPSSPEPDAFRMIGVPPSSLAPKARFCFFCGTTRTSCWYTIRDLLGWKEVNGEKIVSTAPSRGSCNGCYTFRLKRTKEEGVPKDVWEGGERRTMLWTTEQLLVRGMRMRKEVVEGR